MIVLFLNILAWAWVAFSATALIVVWWLKRRGLIDGVEPHAYVIPATMVAVAWLVAGAFT